MQSYILLYHGIHIYPLFLSLSSSLPGIVYTHYSSALNYVAFKKKMEERKQASQTKKKNFGNGGGRKARIISEETMRWINKSSSPKLKTKPFVAPFKSGSGRISFSCFLVCCWLGPHKAVVSQQFSFLTSSSFFLLSLPPPSFLFLKGNFGSCGSRFDVDSEFYRTPGIPCFWKRTVSSLSLSPLLIVAIVYHLTLCFFPTSLFFSLLTTSQGPSRYQVGESSLNLAGASRFFPLFFFLHTLLSLSTHSSIWHISPPSLSLHFSSSIAGGKISSAAPKSELDWIYLNAPKTPGPAQYGLPTMSSSGRGVKFPAQNPPRYIFLLLLLLLLLTCCCSRVFTLWRIVSTFFLLSSWRSVNLNLLFCVRVEHQDQINIKIPWTPPLSQKEVVVK